MRSGSEHRSPLIDQPATNAVDLPRPTILRRVFYGPSELHPIWRLLIFAGIVYALGKASSLALGGLLRGLDDDSRFLILELTDFLIFLLASWIMGRLERRTIADYGLPWRRMFGARFWQGAALGFATISGLLIVMRLAGVVSFGGLALHGLDAGKWAVAWALVFILVALREEFYARGYALFTLSAAVTFWPAALLTSAYFGYHHHGNSGEDWIGLVNAAVAGLLFCLLLRRTGNLWMPIGFHVAFDWGETYFYGVPDSGQVMPGHLLISTSSGAAWLSGGTVGPEGSVLCALTLLAVGLICAWRLREVRYPLRRRGGPRAAQVIGP